MTVRHQSTMRTKEPTQKYEVLSYEAHLELLDVEGREAVYVRKQRLRFLQDGVTAIDDYGWGNGIAFASHYAHPGRFVDRRIEGSRLRSTVELSKPYDAGEELTFSVERLIKNGFESKSEWWLEAELYHRARRVSLTVVLPSSRRVKSAKLVRPGISDAIAVVPKKLPDGRRAVTHLDRRPVQGARYTLLWDW